MKLIESNVSAQPPRVVSSQLWHGVAAATAAESMNRVAVADGSAGTHDSRE